MNACRECRYRANAVAMAQRDLADLARRMARSDRLAERSRERLARYKAAVQTAREFLAVHESECTS